MARTRLLAPLVAASLALAACGGTEGTAGGAGSPTATSATVRSPATTDSAGQGAGPRTTTPTEATAEPTSGRNGPGSIPSEPGDTAWYELWSQGTGVPTALAGGGVAGGFHEGHVFRAGTLDAGTTVRLELPDPHAFADGPRVAFILVGSDDGAASELLMADATTGDTEPVLSSEQIVWGGSLAPDLSAIYYVPVDRTTMTDAGLWRLELASDAEAERVIDEFNPATYDFASQVRFAWTPDGEHLIGQYCRVRDCLQHVLHVASGESLLHDQPGVFELRGATNSEYVADASQGDRRSGILAIDLETLDSRVLSEEWGVSEVRRTAEGPVVAYLSPTDDPWHFLLVGIPLRGEPDPSVVYEERPADAPPEHHTRLRGGDYEPPEGWMVLWPGSPGHDGDPTWEPTFLALEIFGDEEMTFPYEFDPPR